MIVVERAPITYDVYVCRLDDPTDTRVTTVTTQLGPEATRLPALRTLARGWAPPRRLHIVATIERTAQ